MTSSGLGATKSERREGNAQAKDWNMGIHALVKLSQHKRKERLKREVERAAEEAGDDEGFGVERVDGGRRLRRRPAVGMDE